MGAGSSGIVAAERSALETPADILGADLGSDSAWDSAWTGGFD